MPADTAAKRFSALNISSPWRGLDVVPNAAIPQGERQAALAYYSGILWAAVAPIGPAIALPDLVSPIVPAAQYRFWVYSPADHELLAILDTYERAEIVLNENDVSTLVLSLPSGIYDPDLFQTDTQIYIYRVLGEVETLEGNAPFFLRIPDEEETEGARESVVLTALHANELLRRRIVAYNAGNSYTHKLDEADDMMKAVMRENYGALATDSARNLSAYLTIAADLSDAPIVRLEFAREVVLDVLRDLAEASDQAGTWLGFGIVVADPLTGELEFRTYTQTSDVDRRQGTEAPLLIGPDYGNLTGTRLRRDSSEEINFVYAGGEGDEFIRPIATAQDAVRIALSPFNRREAFVDASRTLDADALQAEADAGVRRGRPRVTLEGTLKDLPQARYGIDFRLGTLVTASRKGELFDCRVSQVHLTLSPGEGEVIEIRLRSMD